MEGASTIIVDFTIRQQEGNMVVQDYYEGGNMVVQDYYEGNMVVEDYYDLYGLEENAEIYKIYELIRKS